ncbi:3-methyl-2-oxobutanoate hydroxymethyltransferase [Rubellicoccus peritrichatus]|uniref:3-methyl-2-oxobutanoate hydroxymethyltransferase n=1 Tax=Rubellicoccus peritrichatus TaxID=3080537 RepID=A0AAQ3L7P0_9BACT|nr:3-methyl-2-oxobutanoate hydroxymethyltransferase [Puniceicoccus sp. CR14]WOO40596.1 3-methyl-2-oxobutanoate hydroxymethyltransferase [Puniceicoccus sp. CR14]
MPKLTIHDLYQAKKEGRQLTEVRTGDVNEAIACAEAGVDIIMCMKDELAAIRAAVPDTFIISANKLDRPHIASPDQAISAGFELMNMGADAIYSGMSMKVVEAMSREYIPVVGHIGFVPYRSTWLGGTRAVGKTASEAIGVYEAAKAYQDAGAIGVEIEIVPAKVTEEIGKRLDIILMSMGSGSVGATVQYLFATDVLGTNTGHIPRHAKVYGNLAKEEARVQQLRVEAFKAFQDEVTGGAYPTAKHSLKIKDEEFEKFLTQLPK